MDVATKGSLGRRVNWNEPVLAELRLPNEENPVGQINVGTIKSDHFAYRSPELANNPISVAIVRPLRRIPGEMRRHASMSDANSASLRMRGGGIALDLGKALRSGRRRRRDTRKTGEARHGELRGCSRRR
ncbi:hypothetical protein LRP31_32735 (plasmid) [Mesorhizobium mediterraneum]|nr:MULTISPECIES: hypothetical protein [Mesorhizobium]WIW57109.1 hypothetical protein LRP31_32735 [Mesorhizobium mediterraneum]